MVPRSIWGGVLRGKKGVWGPQGGTYLPGGGNGALGGGGLQVPGKNLGGTYPPGWVEIWVLGWRCGFWGGDGGFGVSGGTHLPAGGVEMGALGALGSPRP